MFFHANGQPKAEKSDRIKLAKHVDTSLVHFQSGDYIISFQSKDLDRIYNKLEITEGFQTKDTLDFLKYIQLINATGKGNWTNNYRFNILLREIMDKGDINVFCISRNTYLKTIWKKNENVPAAGEIYFYNDHSKTVFQFAEAFVGTPNF
jgi:hypothetical protein